MKRFIQFNDETVHSFLILELTDLARTLSENPEIEVEYSSHSYLDQTENKLYVSHFWDHRPSAVERDGLKSDVYLLAIGSKYTDFQAVRSFIQRAEQSSLPSLLKQLFVVGEHIRLEEICRKERPGTKNAFAARRKTYRQFFLSQQRVNLEKSLIADSLFNSLFLLLNAESPETPPAIHEDLDRALPYITQVVMRFYESKSSSETAKYCLQLSEVLEDLLERDMLNKYFHLHASMDFELYRAEETYDEMRRKDPLANNDILEEEKSGEEEVIEEEFRTWHRETSEKGNTFLQFDLDQGSKTDILGNRARGGEEGDQALGMVQGSSQKTNRTDFSSIEEEAAKQIGAKNGSEEAEYGKENRFAFPVFEKADPPDEGQIQTYQEKRTAILLLQKKLKNMIEKTLEHKKIHPRTNLHTGRLDRNLLPFFMEDYPRLFYKKQNESPEIDAVFTLLVDCSASMQDKMEETKQGIVLFHEALKSVRVSHEIIGFWEDTSEATDKQQPNHLKTVIDYSTSLQAKSGPEIMQLQPEEDNRDGFVIRLVTKRMNLRSEKQKFLIVFSDGEPAAFDYDRNGVVDTHEAVFKARKQGIEVINLYLADGEIEESQKETIQNIYGKYSLFVPDINELPNTLFPLLKKLLYKSI